MKIAFVKNALVSCTRHEVGSVIDVENSVADKLVMEGVAVYAENKEAEGKPTKSVAPEAEKPKAANKKKTVKK